MSSGCYIITHRPTGRFYIGAAFSLPARLQQHRGAIRRGNHHNSNLRALGTDCSEFSFRVLLICATSDRKIYEDRLLTAYKSVPGFLNRQLAGYVPTDEVRARLSADRTGKKRPPFSAEWRERLGAVTRGKRMSPRRLAQHSDAMKNRTISPLGRARMLAAHKGKKRRPETGARISATKRRRPKPTHCGKGHEFSSDNEYIWTSPKTGRTKRRCRRCDAAREKTRVRDWKLDGIRRKARRAHKAACP